MKTFSVVIATRNRQALLAQTLEALAVQTWPHDHVEVIVADNGSTDGTREVVQAAARPGGPSLRYLSVPTPGKSLAVNQAVAIATGDIVAYTDDDVRPEPQWLERIAAAIEETGAHFVAGRVLPIWETPQPEWLSPAVFGVIAVPDNGERRVAIEPGGDGAIMPIGANMAVTRAVVARVGGLRADLGKLEGTLRGGEDHEYFLRMLQAGCRGVYEPTAIVHHWVPAARVSRGYFRRWFYRNGRDVARLEPLFPSASASLLGLPRYLWRQAGGDLWSLMGAVVTGRSAERFRAGTRLLWFSGYVTETWCVRPQARPQASSASGTG